jgi:ComF family protein
MHLTPPIRALLAFLFPDNCVSCGEGLDSARRNLCAECEAGLQARGGVVALPVPPDVPAPGEPLLARYGFVFEGTARALIHALKYEGRTSVAGDLAARALPALPPACLGGVEAIVPVPLSAVRRRERGFNQSELLARHISLLVGVPGVRALARVPGGGAQAGSDRVSRLSLRSGVFVSTGGRVPGSALLVDDVLTTGATMAAAAHALRRAGTRNIACFAVAARPTASAGQPESG